jgi:hypothetical protein
MKPSLKALSRLELAQEAAYGTGDKQFASDLRALLDFYYTQTNTPRQPAATDDDMEE